MKRHIQSPHLTKSNVYDNVVFLLGISRKAKSLHPLNEGVCRNIWQNENFSRPGFGDRTFKVNRSVSEKIIRHANETIYVKEHSRSLMAKNGREGAMYAEQVEWVSPTGGKFIGNLVIIAKIYIGIILVKLPQRNQLKYQDPISFSKTFCIKTTCFEDNLVIYFSKIKVIKQVKRSNSLICRALKKFLVITRPLLSVDKFNTKTNIQILH